MPGSSLISGLPPAFDEVSSALEVGPMFKRLEVRLWSSGARCGRISESKPLTFFSVFACPSCAQCGVVCSPFDGLASEFERLSISIFSLYPAEGKRCGDGGGCRGEGSPMVCWPCVGVGGWLRCPCCCCCCCCCGCGWGGACPCCCGGGRGKPGGAGVPEFILWLTGLRLKE